MSKHPLYFSLKGESLDRVAALQATLGCASPEEAMSVALGIAAAVSGLIDRDGVLTVIDPAPDVPEEERQVAFEALPGRGASRRDAA
jgi:hypothetical protein